MASTPLAVLSNAPKRLPNRPPPPSRPLRDTRRQFRPSGLTCVAQLVSIRGPPLSPPPFARLAPQLQVTVRYDTGRRPAAPRPFRHPPTFDAGRQSVIPRGCPSEYT